MDSHNSFAMTCYLNVRYLNVVVANPVVNKTKGKKKMDFKKAIWLNTKLYFFFFQVDLLAVSKSRHSDIE